MFQVFGLMSAEKYFYLNQGGSYSIDGKNDQEDFETFQSAMQVLWVITSLRLKSATLLLNANHPKVLIGDTFFIFKVLGFANDERETIFKILASILHIGNVYFHRKQLKYGQEGVEVGSDLEIKWAAHLLQVSVL